MKQPRVEIGTVEQFGLDINGGGKHVLVCLDHGFIIQDTNKKRLMTHKNHSSEWCELCQEENGTK